MENEIYTNEAGHVHVRTVIMVDGKPTYHRHVISPGDDYSNEDAKVQAICKTVHTPAAIKASKASVK